eukprot:6908977-Lingulodinium_polyedra.AAC.1
MASNACRAASSKWIPDVMCRSVLVDCTTPDGGVTGFVGTSPSSCSSSGLGAGCSTAGAGAATLTAGWSRWSRSS